MDVMAMDEFKEIKVEEGFFVLDFLALNIESSTPGDGNKKFAGFNAWMQTGAMGEKEVVSTGMNFFDPVSPSPARRV